MSAVALGRTLKNPSCTDAELIISQYFHMHCGKRCGVFTQQTYPQSLLTKSIYARAAQSARARAANSGRAVEDR